MGVLSTWFAAYYNCLWENAKSDANVSPGTSEGWVPEVCQEGTRQEWPTSRWSPQMMTKRPRKTTVRRWCATQPLSNGPADDARRLYSCYGAEWFVRTAEANMQNDDVTTTLAALPGKFSRRRRKTTSQQRRCEKMTSWRRKSPCWMITSRLWWSLNFFMKSGDPQVITRRSRVHIRRQLSQKQTFFR